MAANGSASASGQQQGQFIVGNGTGGHISAPLIDSIEAEQIVVPDVSMDVYQL